MTRERDRRIYELQKQGKTYREIMAELDLTYAQVLHGLRRAREAESGLRQKAREPEKTGPGKRSGSITAETLLHAFGNDALTINELADRLDRGPRAVEKAIENAQAAGYAIVRTGNKYIFSRDPVPGEAVHTHTWKGDTLRFGVIADTHLCSKYCRIDLLNEFYDIIAAEGIDTVFHAGDLVDGEGVYRGHAYELEVIGSDAQVDYAVKNYPRRKGVTTKFITGNHDLSYFKNQGQDVGVAIAEKRPDMVYLGQLQAFVKLTDTLTIQLLHPDGGLPYSISYRPQKIIEGIFGGKKPNLLIIGHLHQALYLFERNIHCLLAGSWQDQTPYLTRKGIWPKLSGWIVEIGITQEGERGDAISYCRPELKCWFTHAV